MQSLTFDLGGPIHVGDFGGEGAPIVLVHGIGGSHVNWWSVAPELIQHGRVLAIDLVGCGYSKPAGRQCRLSTNLDVVERLIHKLGEPAVLVGHSMGGLLSLLLSARSPELVDRMVLVDPSQRGESPKPNPRFVAQLMLPSIPVIGDRLLYSTVGRKTAEERVHDAWSVSMVDQARVSANARRAAVEMADHWFAQPWHRQVVATSIVSTGRALIDPERYEQAVTMSRCPTLLLHGEKDHMIRAQKIAQFRNRRPDWTLTFIPDAGHSPHLEAADQVVAEIDKFLLADEQSDGSVYWPDA